MEINKSIPEFLAELDTIRVSRGMSYQDVADACGVSKATIHRALTGATEPTMQLVQSISSAVQYVPPTEEIVPTEFTKDGYITYLQECMRRQREEHDAHVRQLQSHYNRLIRQNRRTENLWAAVAITLSATFIVLFLYDFAHLDRGWITAHQSGLTRTGAYLSVCTWLRRLLWNA